MIQKDSLSDDTLFHFNSMDKYLSNNSNNINPMALQKQVNQNIQQSYVGVKEGATDENLRSRSWFNANSVNQTQFNHIGHQYNRMPVMIGTPQPTDDQLTMRQLYMISNNYQPIDKLTLSVDNGNLWGPSHLPPDQSITEVEFHLTDDSLNQINIRDDLDIVILSRFTKENAINLLSWPSSIKISVNDIPLDLDLTMYNKIPLHLPQFIKRNCLPGRNIVKFEVCDISMFNHQLFQFHIYMVHRPTISHATKLTMSNALVSNEQSIMLLQDNCVRLGRNFLNISTICPITGNKIEIPIRFKDCGHLQPFDLTGFLKMQARWMLNICPLCRNNMYFNFKGNQQNIIIDPILKMMFEKTPPGCDMIKVERNGRSMPIYNKQIAEYNHMMPQMNGSVAMQPRLQFHSMGDLNNPMIPQQMRSSLPMYRYAGTDIPFSGGMQSPHGLQYRSMPSNGPPMMIANRSLLDFHPCDTVTSGHQSPVKKATKRKAPAKKSAPKSTNNIGISSNLNDTIVTLPSNYGNNCPTPLSTRTSSVASTSSPDSLNVPHSVPKRSPSLDHLSSNGLSESHLNDELLLYSSASTNQMNTKSIFSESHFTTTVDDLVSFAPSSSSCPSSFINPSTGYYQHRPPGWNTDSPMMFSQPQQHPPLYDLLDGSEHPLKTEPKDASEGPLASTDYIDQIMANHDPVPDLSECDWLSGVVLGNEIEGLSDIEGF